MSSDEESERDVNGDDEEAPHRTTLPTPLHFFTLMDDPIGDHHHGSVHPDVLRNYMSTLACFHLFMSYEMVELLCLWINVHAAKFFMDSPTMNSNKFMGK